MAIFKCKICGGTLEIDNSQSVAICEYCGTKQTLPKLDDDRRANLYDRANHFRRNNDFDKAMGIYENILNEDNTDAEAYWSIVLCRYGIEYVEDPSTHKRVPTVNRAQFTSIFDDEDYKAAIANADGYQREIYEAEATAINEIQKGILAISQKEEPFDVFICYKETDSNGRRTQDSVLATELYNELTREGFTVFFSRITLEDKLGVAYEPYIFAALQSAKVMVVLGTRPEYFNAVWVKNEWSRYLALIKNGAKKTLIPAYRDMDPYDLPEQFSHLQAQDMSKLGFMQDLTRGIKKIIGFDNQKNTVMKETVITGVNAGIEPLFKRASMALADGEFGSADAFYERILNQDPENAEAYVGKLLSELHIKKTSDLADSEVSFESSNNYKKAIQFANAELKNELLNALQTVITRIDNKKKDKIYQRAKVLLNGARDIPSCKNAQKLFISISGYLDAEQYVATCQEKIDAFQKEWEQLRLEQRKKEEKRRIALKRMKKRLSIIGLCLLVLVVLSTSVYVSVFRVAIPNSHYQDAIELIEEQQYDDAVELLETAKQEALFAKTISKIEKAIDSAKAAKALAKAAEEAAKAIEQAITDAPSTIENSSYNKAVEELLASGLAVELVYQPNGGILLHDETTLDTTEFLYGTKDSFDQIFNSKKTGYRFVGWSCEKHEYQHSNQTFQIVLNANWSEKEYVIEYNLGGGTASNVAEYGVEDEAFTLTNPQRTGYTFVGWTGTDLSQPTMNVTIPTGSHGDRTYTANWQANTYSVSFDPAGGSCTTTEKTYTYDSSATLPTPQRDAYTFVGWYNGTQMVSSGTWKTASNGTLVAKWTPITYQITYNLGKVPAPNSNKTQFTVESDTITLSNLWYNYCAFEGWYSDSDFTNKVTSIPGGTTGNITLYAKWNIKTFAIEYDWNGGDEVTSAKKTYTVLDLPISLSTPQKSEHSFYYWAQGELDGKPIKQIETCGNYKLVANYIPDGLELRCLYGGTREGTWCEASYKGDSTHIEIPKYHMERGCRSPYIEAINLTWAPQVSSLSFSSEIKEVDITKVMTFQEFENGAYIGSRDNPYHALVGKVDKTLPVRTIHEDTAVIGHGVFSGDSSLLSIVIPKNVKEINAFAFSDCVKLTEVYNLSSMDIRLGLGMSHGNLEAYADAIYTSLDEESAISIRGDFVFFYNKTIQQYQLIDYLGDALQLSLPEKINGCNYSIGSYAFYKSDLISIVIPKGVFSIGFDAFEGCTNLLEIYNLSSLDISIGYSNNHGGIGSYASVIHTSMDETSIFTKQGEYYFYRSGGEYRLFAYTGNDTALILPDNINGCSYRISAAFSSNADVISITIPRAVTSISPYAFSSWSKLKEAFFEVTTGWKRDALYSDPPTIYESSYLEDPQKAAAALRSSGGTSEPMYRTE